MQFHFSVDLTHRNIPSFRLSFLIANYNNMKRTRIPHTSLVLPFNVAIYLWFDLIHIIRYSMIYDDRNQQQLYLITISKITANKVENRRKKSTFLLLFSNG